MLFSESVQSSSTKQYQQWSCFRNPHLAATEAVAVEAVAALRLRSANWDTKSRTVLSFDGGAFNLESRGENNFKTCTHIHIHVVVYLDTNCKPHSLQINRETWRWFYANFTGVGRGGERRKERKDEGCFQHGARANRQYVCADLLLFVSKPDSVCFSSIASCVFCGGERVTINRRDLSRKVRRKKKEEDEEVKKCCGSQCQQVPLTVKRQRQLCGCSHILLLSSCITNHQSLLLSAHVTKHLLLFCWGVLLMRRCDCYSWDDFWRLSQFFCSLVCCVVCWSRIDVWSENRHLELLGRWWWWWWQQQWWWLHWQVGW